MSRLQNVVISGAQGLVMYIDGYKIFIKGPDCKALQPGYID